MTQHTRGTYGPKIGRCHPKNVTNTRTVALLILVLVVLVSPPHQVRTAADTASEDNSCGHRRCWTAAASKGLFCLACVVLVLVAVRFGSWTMMAELCFSVDYFIVLFSSNFSNSSSVIASFPLPSASALRVKLCLTDRVWVNRPKRTSNHERLYIHETAATPSVTCLLYTSPSPRDKRQSRMPSSA